MIEPGGLLALCRFALDSGALFIWGAGAYLAAFVAQPLSRDIWPRLAVIRWSAVFAITIGSAATLPLQAAILGDGWASATDPSIIATILLKTDIGTAWLYQAAAVLLLLGAQAPRLRRQIAPTAIAALLVLATLPLSGHASMHTGYFRLFQRANDLLHLAAGGFWLGGLAAFILILPRLRHDHSRPEAAKALIAFSRTGHIAVTLVILSGMASTWGILGGLPLDWNFAYQALLSLKVAIVATMILIAVTNRYVFVPLLGRRTDMLTALAAGSVAEIVLGLAALATVASFGLMQPS